MRLWELFSDLDEKSLSAVERDLDAQDYQPAEKVKTQKLPVIDLDLSSPHVAQRLVQRSKTAGISPEEIEDLFHRGREKFKVEIGQASRADVAGQHIDFYDPESKLLVPTIVQPNPNCKPNSRGKVVCQTTSGPAPKNSLVAKTVVRKGVED
jgi:hypothetical protein